MTSHEKMLYGPFAEAVELREEIVRRTDLALSRATRLRNAIGIVATLITVLLLAVMVVPVPLSRSLGALSAAITLGFGAAWLLSAANVWMCWQRANECRAVYLKYVNGLPTG
jgi:ABC-type nickel/cobalt efflux system permease component RcnA